MLKHAVRYLAACGKGKQARLAILFGLLIAFSLQATAELMQVQVGGELRIRGRYYINAWAPARTSRIPNDQLFGRPIGARGTQSLFKWDSDGPDWTRYETAVLLNVKADFTEDVSAFIELYDFHIWGEEFRSNYLTGADLRANAVDSVMLNQGYIEMRNLFGQPLRLRLGRQDLVFGKGWLVMNMTTPSQFISFDAARLTYESNGFTVDAFASKLTEDVTNPNADVDFYGVHGTYAGWAPLSVSAYWFFIHDGRDIERFETTDVGRWLNSAWGYDYDSTRLHTIGTRAFGKSGNFDYDLELAYQFGDAEHLGAMFKPIGSNFGDANAKYDNWAMDAILGYTFKEVTWQPRVYAQAVAFSGEDNRDITFWDWMNPFYRPEASVSFNRLFTDKNYCPTVNDNSWMSNFYQANLGIELQPTEKLRLHMHVARTWVYDPFDPPKTVRFGGRDVRIAPGLSFWTNKGSDDVGYELAAWARYNYSQDLWFLLYGNYLWADDGLTDGAFMHFYGTEFSGGSDNDDAAYFFWMAVLKF